MAAVMPCTPTPAPPAGGAAGGHADSRSGGGRGGKAAVAAVGDNAEGSIWLAGGASSEEGGRGGVEVVRRWPTTAVGTHTRWCGSVCYRHEAEGERGKGRGGSSAPRTPTPHHHARPTRACRAGKKGRLPSPPRPPPLRQRAPTERRHTPATARVRCGGRASIDGAAGGPTPAPTKNPTPGTRGAPRTSTPPPRRQRAGRSSCAGAARRGRGAPVLGASGALPSPPPPSQ